MTTYKIVVKFNNDGSKIHWLAVQRGLGADWRLVQCLGSRALARAALKSARQFGTPDDELPAMAPAPEGWNCDGSGYSH